jgi:hypothetical protein
MFFLLCAGALIYAVVLAVGPMIDEVSQNGLAGCVSVIAAIWIFVSIVGWIFS